MNVNHPHRLDDDDTTTRRTLLHLPRERAWVRANDTTQTRVGQGGRRGQTSASVTAPQAHSPTDPGTHPQKPLISLALLLLLCFLSTGAAHAQNPNLPPNCTSYSDILLFYKGIYLDRVYCADPWDSGPLCPSSGTTGTGGPASGGGMTTGHYIPPVASHASGGAEQEMAALAGSPEGEAGVAYAMEGGGCCGGSGGPVAWGGGGWPGGGGGQTCCDFSCCEEGGMAFWWVSEPYISLFLRDKPFFYNTSRGRQVAFEMHYKNTPGINGMTDNSQPGIFSAGTNWHLPWRSYLQRTTNYSDSFFGFLGDGSARQYNAGDTDYASGSTLVAAANNQYHLCFRSGSTNIYGTWITLNGNAYCFLSRKVDITGAATTFSYSSNNATVLLTNVVDVDGRNTTFVYTNNGYYSNLLAEVHGPYNLNVYLKYSSKGQLTNIQDVVGLNSGMDYTNGNLARLFTPYGTTAFNYYNTNGWNALLVDEQGLRQHLYLGGFNATNVLSSATNEAATLGTNLAAYGVTETVERGTFDERNTFYWGPRQYANLSSSIRTALTNLTFNPASLTTNEFQLGVTHHWLPRKAGDGSGVFLSDSLSLERGP